MAHPDFSSVRAVFFDLDDTLCGYWEAAAVGLRKTFEQIRPEGLSVEDMVGHWASAFRKFSKTIKASHWYEIYLDTGGPTRTEQMRLTLEEAGHPSIEMAQALADLYMRERDASLKLFPEALGVLEALHGKYPMGLITNGPADIQNQEIDTLDIRKFFNYFLIEGEMREGKPLRAVFERAQSWAGFEPHELLFIGNSFNHDMSPAISCGWRTYWVRRESDVPPSAYGQTETIEPIPTDKPLPDAIEDSLEPLLEYLGVTK